MGTKNETKKRMQPWQWGMLTAVLLLGAAAVVLLTRMKGAEEEPFTLPPMVYAADARYLYEGDITDTVTEQMQVQWEYLGEITSVVAETEYVSVNFQANTDVLGAAVYRWDVYIVLRYGETYTLYRPMDEVGTFAYTAEQ